MKKFLFGFLITAFFITCSYAAEIDLVPMVGLDLDGTFRSDYEVYPLGLRFGGEARYHLSNYFSVAAGFEYLVKRTIKNTKELIPNENYEKEGDPYYDGERECYYSDKTFSFLPVYASILFYPAGNYGEYKPYIRGDFGYNVIFAISNHENSSPGVYYGGAIGFELYETYLMEISASCCMGNDNNEEITYKKIGFKVGYKFTV